MNTQINAIVQIVIYYCSHIIYQYEKKNDNLDFFFILQTIHKYIIFSHNFVQINRVLSSIFDHGILTSLRQEAVVGAEMEFVFDCVVATVVEQPLRQLEELVRHREVPRRLTSLVLVIDICALGDKILAHLRVSILTGHTQHRVAKVIRFIDMKWQSVVSV